MALGLAAALKTWPLILLVAPAWRGRDPFWRLVRGAGAVGVALLVAVAVLLGPEELWRWGRATVSGSSQTVVHTGLLGVGRQLFSANTAVAPLQLSPALATLSTVVALLFGLALVAAAVLRGSDPDLRFWNVVATVVLVLPVVHFVYWLVALPLVWVRAAHLLRHPRAGLSAWLPFGLLLAWWWVAVRQPAGQMVTIDRAGYLTILAGVTLAITASVVGDLRQGRPSSARTTADFSPAGPAA